MKHYYHISLIGIFILAISVVFSYLPDFYRKAADRIAYFFELKHNYEIVKDWQINQTTLNSKHQLLTQEISFYATDIPSEDKPQEIVDHILDLMKEHKITSHSLVYQPNQSEGKYIRWPLDIEFEAHYQNGIHFLNAIETHQKLIRIQKLQISNKKNRVARKITFKSRLILTVLKT